MPIVPSICVRPFPNVVRNFEKWRVNTGAVSVWFAVTSGIREHLIFITWILQRKTLVFQYEDSRDRGEKSKKKSRNVLSYARIVIVRYTQALRSFLKKFRLKNEVNSGKP